jgi:CsoR family transcriptional regulator, copper-sensing transcriptional repressor
LDERQPGGVSRPPFRHLAVSSHPAVKETVSQDAKRRLARISGQVAGLQKMVDEQRYCVDILTQVAALRAALDQFGILMLSTHLEDCVYGTGSEGHDHADRTPEERLEELKVTLNRFLK